jgi:transposase
VVPVQQQVRQRADGSADAEITFKPEQGAWPVCSGCGQVCWPVHSYGQRWVRDLPLAHAYVELMVPQRKVRCATCGIRVEALTFVEPYHRYTKRFERAVAELCRVMTVAHVAEYFGLSWHTVKEIDRRRLQAEVGTPCYEGLRLLAVDEIAVRKGHQYLTIVLDLESGRVVWIGEGRSEETLAGFFAELTVEQRAAIEAVATDMAPGYRAAVEAACPQAALVYDLFHVVAKYSREVVDRVRSREARKQTGPQRQYIKGSRYLLLRNRNTLWPDERLRLDALLDANERLNLVYILKDQLKWIWTYKRRGWARRAIEQWCSLAQASGIQELVRFAGNLARHAEGILNHCGFPLHTGRLEGVNNKIKVMKRQAYGYRDQAYFMLKIKDAFRGTVQLNPR